MRAWSTQNRARRHSRGASVGARPCHEPCLLEDKAKGPLHKTMAQLKAGQVGVTVAWRV